MAFKDENQFGAGDREDEFRTEAFLLESADMESPDEESPDGEEEIELSEKELAEEMKPFTVADWKKEFPDYTAEELEEKLPKRTRSSWMAPDELPVGHGIGRRRCRSAGEQSAEAATGPRLLHLFSGPGASILLCRALAFRSAGGKCRKKMKDEQKDPAGSEPILPNQDLQQEAPSGSGPIHPK